MTDFEALQQLCNTADQLSNKYTSASSPDFKAWKTKADRLLIRRFGEDSYEFKSFNKISYSLSLFTTSTPDSAFVKACASGLRKAKAVLETYLDEFSDQEESASITNIGDFSKVFIVHGHDGELRERVARIIERQGLKAVILNEQSNHGQTIIEKLETEGSAAGAVCLFTADDEGKSRVEQSAKPRARQNVVFETGYFIGRLGRENITILVDKGIEIPSDLQGVVYTGTDNWEFSLLKELRSMGYSIDFNKMDF
ncbi:nucleotide-binding protein [Slackia exigua]|uniref:nucleotide-binding protein n=1 Tax=Slackia exigua TaxID=84109 RepID=UPI00254C845C|nr:nucleotide-binding protein [Slackia exigua]MDK7723917.1 nucleotide-binding protein [Slackia exigua]MDK7725148.1 nucleotide-binding protein [Slackia exigua]